MFHKVDSFFIQKYYSVYLRIRASTIQICIKSSDLLIFKLHLNTVLLSHFIVLELTRYLKIQWSNDMITMNQVHKGTFPYAMSTLKNYAVQNITYLLLLLHHNYNDLTNQSTHLLPCSWNLLPMCEWYSELNWTSNKSLRD
jgi:hypothetical protein